MIRANDTLTSWYERTNAEIAAGAVYDHEQIHAEWMRLRFPALSPDYDRDDCPDCDGTGDAGGDPDYTDRAKCATCGGTGWVNVAPQADEEPRSDTYAESGWL
jgi:hypothetical protein